MSGGWYLKSRRVPVPLVPREYCERRDEILFILPLDMRDDLAYDLNFYN
jgi:hypothetical protein